MNHDKVSARERARRKQQSEEDRQAGKRLRRLSLAAEYAGQSPRTLRRRIAEGTLTGYKLGSGRLVLVDLDEIDAMLRPVPTLAAGA